MGVAVEALYVYPIKSCRAVELKRAAITPTGFAFDRLWMVVRESDGKFISQRQEPKLALVNVGLPQAALDATAAGEAVPPGLMLRVAAPGQPDTLEVKLDPPAANADVRQSSVWEWHGPAADAGDAAAAWFSSYLDKPVRLVRYAGRQGGGNAASDPQRRPTAAEWAPQHETAFADGFPYLLISQGSMAQLNSHLPKQLPMNRFRPNIVVSGAEPFAEDGWRAFRVQGGRRPAIEFEAIKPCDRCKETTVDQVTGEVGAEPLETLRRVRNGAKLGWADSSGMRSWKHAVFMGQNLVTNATSGTVSVGDAVEVTQAREAGSDGTLRWQKGPAAQQKPQLPEPVAQQLKGGHGGWPQTLTTCCGWGQRAGWTVLAGYSLYLLGKVCMWCISRAGA